MSRTALRLIRAGALKKGDPLQTARLAGIMAAKQTSTLIPLCHPLTLSHVDVALDAARDGYAIEARVRTTDRTGVEMEALTAVAVAALTIYDMVKAVDKTMVIGDDPGHREARRPERRVPRASTEFSSAFTARSRCGTIPPSYVERLRARLSAPHVPPCPYDAEAWRSPARPRSLFAGQILASSLLPRRRGCAGCTARRPASAACCFRRWWRARSSSRTRAGCRRTRSPSMCWR